MSRRRRHRQEIPADERTQTVRVERIVEGGSGLAHLPDGRAALVAFAAPGELVEVTVERVHKDYVQGVVSRVIEPSPDRVQPRCALFGECGGCQLQHLTYEAQLAAKEDVAREQLGRIGGLEGAPVRPIAGADDPWGYRNHIRFSTGRRFGDVGFVPRGRRGLLKVESCPIADPWVNEMLPKLQGKGAGLHQIQLRRNAAAGSTLIAPAIAGLEAESGQDHYTEALGGRTFRVSASAFFQVNNAQAERLVALVGEALPSRGSLLVDAYAGVGTFAVLFAGRFDRVVAIEESASATRDAAENVAGTPNVAIHTGKVEAILPELDLTPDAVLLDPPRAGCAPPVLEAIVANAPDRVVYVSCNPTTLARDLRVLVEGGYRLDGVTPVDMFPQTAHIECVAELTRERA